MSEVREFLVARWQASSALARAGLVAALALLAAFVIGSTYWLFRDDYQVLFADLSAPDAAAMVAELDRSKTPYRLADGGTTILVAREAVYKTRLKLMGKGLDLHGTVGLEIFNNTDFGMTEFAQKVNYQRALQGELARTIGSFAEVKWARVHLVLPESGLFKRRTMKPKASITLALKGDTRLEAEQILGIQRLVAASVPEMQAAAVTIVDQRGVAVSAPAAPDEAEEVTTGRLDAKKRIEDYLTRKVVAVLDRTVGPGKAIVSVDVILNYDQVKVTKEDILPLPNTEGQNVGAVARRRESAQGEPLAESPVAARSALPGVLAAETEFLTGRRIENTISAPGGIQRLSIGILVPGISDPVELAKLREMVRLAAGVDATRGDAIAIYPVEPPAVPATATDIAPLESIVAPDPGPRATTPDWPTNPWLLFALALVLLAGVAVARGRVAKPPVPVRLNPEERERMMREVSQWATSRKL